MCGRFSLFHSADEIADRFLADILPMLGRETEPRYNIAPTQNILVVTQEAVRSPRLVQPFHWGLIPSWAKDPAIGNRMINARAETLAEKPSFRTALARRRCLIPADGFYEWQAGEGKAKTPYHIRLTGGELFAFAGLWDEWQSPDGSPVRSCTIITTSPNAVTAPVHDRMPVILRPEDEARWLDPSHTSTADLTALLVPYSADLMEAFAVSKEVNRPVSNGPSLILPMNSA